MHIFQGEVDHQPTQRVTHVTARKLVGDDYYIISKLQQEIVNDLSDKETFQPLTEDELRYILEGSGLNIGVFTGDDLIAYRSLLYPGDNYENLGRDIDLPYEEQMKVVHQEISLVHKDYRGNGLQQTLAKVIMQQLKSSSTYFTHLCCTVSPLNIPSLKDKFNQQMVIVDVKEKYEGYLRYIFYKHLNHDMTVDLNTYVYISIDKPNRQKDFLESGYVGLGLNQTAEGTWVVFGKLI